MVFFYFPAQYFCFCSLVFQLRAMVIDFPFWRRHHWKEHWSSPTPSSQHSQPSQQTQAAQQGSRIWQPFGKVFQKVRKLQQILISRQNSVHVRAHEIVVRVQTFLRRPFVASHNFCHSAAQYSQASQHSPSSQQSQTTQHSETNQFSPNKSRVYTWLD